MSLLPILSAIRASIYHLFAQIFTANIYDELRIILNSEVKKGDVIVEVGPGTGMNLKTINDIIEKNECHYRGIDYDNDYVVELRKNCPRVEDIEIYAGPKEGDFLLYADTEDHRFKAPNSEATIFVLMIECTMLMDQAALAKKMKAVRRQISAGGNKVHFIFAHTEFYKETFVGWIAQFIKPYLKHVSTVDFGIPTYQDDFESFVAGFTNKKVDHIEEKRIPSPITSFGPINIVQVKCAEKTN